MKKNNSINRDVKMTNDNKKYIPALRFPEFQNDGEWSTDTMETIFDIKNGYTPSKSNPSFWDNGTVPWFRMEDIRKNGHILSDSIQHVTPAAVKSAGLFPAYSIIVATTATIGEHALIIVDSLANQRFTFLTKRKSFDNKLDMMYFHYFMFIIDEWCKKNTNAGGLLSVNMNSFKKLTIPYPSSLSEQKKIADCFVSIDKEIDATKRKLEQLKEHKKALMQKLFPVKGKTLPELRFPEFKSSGRWVIKQLGAIGDTYGGLSGKSAEDFGVGKPFVTYKQVFNSLEIDVTECQLVKIADNEKQNNLRYADVLVTMSSETPEEVGYTAVVTNKNISECYLNSFCFIYRLFEDESMDVNFLIYLFSSDVYRTNVVRIAQGITRFNISKTKFKEIELAIPENKDEQRKIAETLSSVDKQIAEYDKKIKALELHKKGLIQQLFTKL